MDSRDLMDLNAIVENIVVASTDGSITVHGVSIGRRQDLGAPDSAQRVLASMTSLLYLRSFAHLPIRWLYASGAVEDDLTNNLRSANSQRPEIQPGWRVEALLDGGALLASRDGVRRVVGPGEYRSAESTGAALIGRDVVVTFPSELPAYQAGFYIALRAQDEDVSDQRQLLRFYWNVNESSATELVRLVTTTFAEARIPFRLKVANNTELLSRRDAAVLYVSQRFFSAVTPIVRDIWRRLETLLRPETPVCALRLRPGLAFAEDPGTNESFGQSRMALLSRAIVASLSDGSGTLADWPRHIATFREQQGEAGNRLYLTRSAVDIYSPAS